MTTFRDPAPAVGSFSKVFVVGVHANGTLRRQFENAVAAALGSSGTQCVTSVSILGTDRALSRDSVVEAAKQSGADAVLVTRLLDVKSRSEFEGGGSVTGTQRKNDVPIADFFRYDYVTYQDPMTITTVRTVLLGSDLYSAASEAKVWSAESTAFDKETATAVIDSVAAALAERLRREGLLKP